MALNYLLGLAQESLDDYSNLVEVDTLVGKMNVIYFLYRNLEEFKWKSEKNKEQNLFLA